MRAPDLAASYQRAIVVPSPTARSRPTRTGAARLASGRGCGERPAGERLAAAGDALAIPPRELRTDNAAMIAFAARFGDPLPFPEYLALDAYASGERALA